MSREEKSFYAVDGDYIAHTPHAVYLMVFPPGTGEPEEVWLPLSQADQDTVPDLDELELGDSISIDFAEWILVEKGLI